MAEPFRTYRVTFAHVRHRTRFLVDVDSPTMDEAREMAGRILARQLGEKAGAVMDWRFAEMEEVAC